MRVLYPLRYYPTLTETFVYREIDAIRQLAPDVEIVIAALGARADGALLDRPPHAPIHRVPRRPLRGRLRPDTPGMQWLRQHQRPKDVARLPWLAHAIGEIDHIHVHFAGEAAEWAYALHIDRGLPYTVTVHAVDLFRPRPSLEAVLSRADAVLTVAEHHRAALQRHGADARLVRCGPDSKTFVPSPTPPGPLRAVFIGRNVPKKGLAVLLKAWSHATLGADAHLTLISDYDGPTPAGVTAAGLQPAHAVQQTIAQSNLLVLPCRRASDGDLDGVPIVLMEALASGRPVLTTPVSGIPELVDEEVGWLVPPDDVEALCNALQTIKEADRAERGARGPARLRARGFTLLQQARGLLDAWAYTHNA
ncbi:MAG: glycosyltransferase family 4 protein [Myxococcota bacterium]